MSAPGAALRADVISLEPPGLRGIRCTTCDRRSFPQRSLCPHCGSFTVTELVFNGHAAVASWTVVHQAPPPLQTPYILATVDFADGIRVLGAAVGAVTIGSTVEVEIFPLRDDADGQPLWWYRFRAIEDKR
jgi:uncharacterized OB-fold protein